MRCAMCEPWQAEVPDLLGDTDRILTQGRERIRQLSEEYYTVTNNADGDAFRPITRTEPIPPTLEEMVAMHEKTFAALQVRCFGISLSHTDTSEYVAQLNRAQRTHTHKHSTGRT